MPGALPPRAPGQPAGSPASARPLERGAPRPALAAWAPRPPADGAPVPRCRARDETRREEERHVRALARIVALACVEAELGLRPARQLSAWLDLPTYGKMVRRADLAGRTRPDRGAAGAPQALGARCCAAAEGVYEASATVRLPDRVRAVALRIERRRERWKVTALELG
ncbi:hypothetical protein E7744_05730 [Citricoccus sp. SGAir0253]|nr:hypothetical protein E7744_05730 [Citricoccus sp. SGAir0253]